MRGQKETGKGIEDSQVSVRRQEETGEGKQAVKQKGKCAGNTAVEEGVLEGSDLKMEDEYKLLKVRDFQAKRGTGSEEKATEQESSESESCIEEDRQ